MEPSTTTTTTQGPCNNTCPAPDWRDPPVLDPWTTTTTTSGGGSTTTSTTEAPCPGTCRFTWSVGSKTWVKSSSTCGEGCACSPPTFCPPDPGTPVCTDTYCYRNSYDSPLPNCTGTTTSYGPDDCAPRTTTTTTIAGCVPGNCYGCDWFCHPVSKRWIGLPGNECDGCNIRCQNTCAGPTKPCLGDCSVVHTDCAPVPPQPPADPITCNGDCLFHWVPATDFTAGYWFRDQDRPGCKFTGLTGSQICSCADPTFEGTYCGAPVLTPCTLKEQVAGTTTTTTRGCPVIPVWTTPPYDPNNPCAGYCYWRSDGAGGWLLSSGCPSCDCAQPPAASSSSCAIAQTPCGVPTTTTTTIPPPTTTTTTPNPCGTSQCVWTCYGPSSTWNLNSNPCNTGCGCVYPTATCGSEQHGAGIGTACIIDGTTTTTTAPAVNCNCVYDPAAPDYVAQKPCSAGLPAAGVNVAVSVISSLLPRCRLLSTGWNCPTKSGNCTYVGTGNDDINNIHLDATVIRGIDGGGNAVTLVYIYDASDGSSLTYRMASPPPIDCCTTDSVPNFEQVGFSECGGLTGTNADLTPLSSPCECSTTTTTTVLPSTTTTTTLPPGTLQYYCIDETQCSMISCTSCTGATTRSCQGWYSTPPTCSDTGATSVHRVIVAGPFASTLACGESCSGTPTTTTAGSAYKCYSCPPEGGGIGIGTCILDGDPVPSGCLGPLSSWSSFAACSAGCVGGITP